MTPQPLISVKDLHLHFNTYAGKAYVLNGVNLEITKNDFMGLVGETGCGKSLTSFSILRLIPPGGEITAGEIRFKGEDLLLKSEKEMMDIRGKDISMVSQDPSAYLNPLFTIDQQMTFVIKQHQSIDKDAITEKARELLRVVELPNPERILKSYPHELSGGMKQRVAIALALSCNPELLIADEPTTDLDVTIQAQILDLLQRLREHKQLTILMVTHDLAVVAETCQSVTVLYAGKDVESGPVEKVLYESRHPYTKALLEASPNPEERGQTLSMIPGKLPSNMEVQVGCPFFPRCSQRMPICNQEMPAMRQLDVNHKAACFLYESKLGR